MIMKGLTKLAATGLQIFQVYIEATTLCIKCDDNKKSELMLMRRATASV